MDIHKTIGNLLRELREEAKFSVSDVAKAVNTKSATLWRYEWGTIRIPLGMLCRLLVYYNQPLLLEPTTKSFRKNQTAVVDLTKLKPDADTESGRRTRRGSDLVA